MHILSRYSFLTHVLEATGRVSKGAQPNSPYRGTFPIDIMSFSIVKPDPLCKDWSNIEANKQTENVWLTLNLASIANIEMRLIERFYNEII